MRLPDIQTIRPEGWTHLGGPHVQLVVGLPADDELTLALSRACDAATDEDVEELLDMLVRDGRRSAPDFALVSWWPTLRVVAKGSGGVEVVRGDDRQLVSAPSRRRWVDVDLHDDGDRLVLRAVADGEDVAAYVPPAGMPLHAAVARPSAGPAAGSARDDGSGASLPSSGDDGRAGATVVEITSPGRPPLRPWSSLSASSVAIGSATVAHDGAADGVGPNAVAADASDAPADVTALADRTWTAELDGDDLAGIQQPGETSGGDLEAEAASAESPPESSTDPNPRLDPQPDADPAPDADPVDDSRATPADGPTETPTAGLGFGHTVALPVSRIPRPPVAPVPPETAQDAATDDERAPVPSEEQKPTSNPVPAPSSTQPWGSGGSAARTAGAPTSWDVPVADPETVQPPARSAAQSYEGSGAGSDEGSTHQQPTQQQAARPSPDSSAPVIAPFPGAFTPRTAGNDAQTGTYVPASEQADAAPDRSSARGGYGARPEPQAAGAGWEQAAYGQAVGDDVHEEPPAYTTGPRMGGDQGTGPLVLAVLCQAGHASPPHRGTCRVCNAPIPDQQPFAMARPSLGALVLSTGDLVNLDRGIIMGRSPSAPEGNGAERPHLVKVPSPSKDISRKHLEVTVDGWHVIVTDLGTTNGTTVCLPGEQPMRLRAHDPLIIEPGTFVSLADEASFTFEVAL